MQLHSEISKSSLKQVCLLFFPGALVILPLFVLLYLDATTVTSSGKIIKYFEDNWGIFYVIGFILSPIVGLILENIGSVIEDLLDSKVEIDTNAWRLYLLKEIDDAKYLIIYKYIDSVVFRYKMELSIIPASIIFMLEWVLIYNMKDNVLHCNVFWSIFVVTLIVMIFTGHQAFCSCKVLNELRIFLVGDSDKNCKKCDEKLIKQTCCFCGKPSCLDT